jgi:hypothetical protein
MIALMACAVLIAVAIPYVCEQRAATFVGASVLIMPVLMTVLAARGTKA